MLQWPDSLPLPLIAPVYGAIGKGERTLMESGRIRHRRLQVSPVRLLEVQWNFTGNGFVDFRTLFQRDLVNGSLPFTIAIFGQDEVMVFRDSAYSLTRSDNLFVVSATLEYFIPETVTAEPESGDVTQESTHEEPSDHIIKQDTVTVVTALHICNVVGDSIVYTATVSSGPDIPDGSVVFSDESGILGTRTLVEGVATLEVAGQTLGDHLVTAFYEGNLVFNASSGTVLVHVINSGDACGGCHHVFPRGPFQMDHASVTALKNYNSAFTGTLTQESALCPINWSEKVGGPSDRIHSLKAILRGNQLDSVIRLFIEFFEGEIVSGWVKTDGSTTEPRGEYNWFGGDGFYGGYPPSHIFIT